MQLARNHELPLLHLQVARDVFKMLKVLNHGVSEKVPIVGIIRLPTRALRSEATGWQDRLVHALLVLVQGHAISPLDSIRWLEETIEADAEVADGRRCSIYESHRSALCGELLV